MRLAAENKTLINSFNVGTTAALLTLQTQIIAVSSGITVILDQSAKHSLHQHLLPMEGGESPANQKGVDSGVVLRCTNTFLAMLAVDSNVGLLLHHFSPD